jgi:glycosyltransferase involved in cell wall biosynthesis
MRITFVTPAPSLSGGYRTVAIHADQLRRRGHEVQIVARRFPRPSARTRLRAIVKEGRWLKRSKPNTTYLDEVQISPYYIASNHLLTDRDLPDADAVIATWWETAEWIAGLSPSKGAKAYLIQDHEIFPYLPVERVVATWRLPFHKIVVSRWLADVARDEYGETDVSVVPNGVDSQRFSAPRRRKSQVPTVGMLYTKTERKSCGVGLRAFATARQRIPQLRLIAFSADNPVPELPLPPGTEFHVRPDQAELPGLYARCDAWLFTSRTEGFGLPILEAMACRTPVIGTPAGAAPELLAGGGGLLVPPENPLGMAGAIEQVLSMSESDWIDLSDRARTTAERYTWDQASELFETALHTAIDKQASAVR